MWLCFDKVKIFVVSDCLFFEVKVVFDVWFGNWMLIGFVGGKDFVLLGWLLVLKIVLIDWLDSL